MNKSRAGSRIIIALDVEELDSAKQLVACLKDYVGAFKIGKQLFTRYGPEAVRMIHEKGGQVFLDLKFHDIPTTVAKASREVARLGVFMFNMHALGGFDMMKQAAASVRDMAASADCSAPIMLAVTVLTSCGPEDLQRVGLSLDIDELVRQLAQLAKDAGMDGVVASPREIRLIKEQCGSEFLVVTPGIRPAQSGQDDQKRIMTPREAVQAGANYIVVGRPVTQAPDPVAVVQAIGREIEQ